MRHLDRAVLISIVVCIAVSPAFGRGFGPRHVLNTNAREMDITRNSEVDIFDFGKRKVDQSPAVYQGHLGGRDFRHIVSTIDSSPRNREARTPVPIWKGRVWVQREYGERQPDSMRLKYFSGTLSTVIEAVAKGWFLPGGEIGNRDSSSHPWPISFKSIGVGLLGISRQPTRLFSVLSQFICLSVELDNCIRDARIYSRCAFRETFSSGTNAISCYQKFVYLLPTSFVIGSSQHVLSNSADRNHASQHDHQSVSTRNVIEKGVFSFLEFLIGTICMCIGFAMLILECPIFCAVG
jgi:hypothetical protein